MFFTSLMRIYLTRSFKPFHFKNELTNNDLSFEALDGLGLYVHIPFCRSLCSFCPYYKVIYDKEIADNYKTALLKEIDIVCKKLIKRKAVTSIYFGGGTPALMINDLKDIIDKLKQYFIIMGGIGVELHPSDISEENLQKLKLAGATMVSIGIQSFNNQCLNKIGRNNNSLIEKLQLVKHANFDVINVDLIFGIPNQTDEIFISDIATAFNNGATQVSTYPFIDFTFTNNQYEPMSQSAKKQILKSIISYCKIIDVDRTSVWTFAKRNTNKYSSVTRDAFLGFGVSATTLLKEIFKINTFSIDEYIKRIDNNSLPTSLTLNFTQRQRAVYYLFWSAYSMQIDVNKFEKIVGIPLDKMFKFEFWLLQRWGLITKKNNNIYSLTDQASYFYHYIEQVYTTAYIDKTWNILSKIAFPEEIILK